MAFVLKQSNTYYWPVSFDLPIDGGRFERQSFDGEFKRLPQSVVGPMIGELDQLESIGDMSKITEAARDVIVGWTGVTDDQGKDIPFSQTALDQILEIPMVNIAILKAFIDSIKGAKRKN